MIVYTYSSELLINKNGVKKITEKVDGSEITFFALEKLSSGNRVVGYTELKSYSSEKYSILSVDSMNFNVMQKRNRFYYRTKCYIPVGSDGNEFIAVVKFRYLQCILLLLLLLGMLLCFNFCNAQVDDKKPWKPVIQDFSNQQQEESESTENRKNYIDVIGFTAISVDKNTNSAKVSLSNPEGNPCYFKFYIFDENGVTLYESDLVPPNKEITKITLNTKLKEGIHKGYVLIETHELETGEEMNFAKFDIDIISQ